MKTNNLKALKQKQYIKAATYLTGLAQEAADVGRSVCLEMQPSMRCIIVEYYKGQFIRCSQISGGDFLSQVQAAANKIKAIINE